MKQVGYLSRTNLRVMNKHMLNLGCGNRFHPDWVNINFSSTDEGVIAADLSKGIPFPDESFDMVYHSHLLEHFSKTDAPGFVGECNRVLRPEGIVRVVVPDLETIARQYLSALENAKVSVEGSEHNYDWMLLEMFDQITRNQSGGEMARYLSQESIPNEEFVVSRCGAEARNLIVSGRERRQEVDTGAFKKRSNVRKALSALLRPNLLRKRLLLGLLGDSYNALQIGRFRLSGENHQWMYDSYSIRRLLEATGFKEFVVRDASESYNPNWSSFNLDTEPDGSIYKPDSLFVEAIKA